MRTGNFKVIGDPQDHGIYVRLQRDCRKNIRVSVSEFERRISHCLRNLQEFFKYVRKRPVPCRGCKKAKKKKTKDIK